jgi:hypothetical protein
VKQERLGTPSEFAARLAGHLADIADPTAPLPSAGQLAALVDATFYASLHDEERRRVDFSVAWQAGPEDCATLIAITPIRATPKNLVRVAPATWRDATSIAVRPDGDELVAWALLERHAAPCHPLTLRALGPGVLRVEYGGRSVALFARGEILFDGAVKSPVEWLRRTFSAWSANDPRPSVVARIATRALAHGHGGMILVVPAGSPLPTGVRVHYEIGAGGDVLVDRYAAVLRDVSPDDHAARLVGSRPRDGGGRVTVRDRSQIAYAEAVELVARLTAIDNALLVDTDLRLRGFGVQVIDGDAPDVGFEHVNPYTDDTHVDDLSTFKGTRHPAGVIFCMRQPAEAAAIIASQDGHLSLAVKDGRGTVAVLGTFEYAFGWQ